MAVEGRGGAGPPGGGEPAGRSTSLAPLSAVCSRLSALSFTVEIPGPILSNLHSYVFSVIPSVLPSFIPSLGLPHEAGVAAGVAEGVAEGVSTPAEGVAAGVDNSLELSVGLPHVAGVAAGVDLASSSDFRLALP